MAQPAHESFGINCRRQLRVASTRMTPTKELKTIINLNCKVQHRRRKCFAFNAHVTTAHIHRLQTADCSISISISNWHCICICNCNCNCNCIGWMALTARAGCLWSCKNLAKGQRSLALLSPYPLACCTIWSEAGNKYLQGVVGGPTVTNGGRVKGIR